MITKVTEANKSFYQALFQDINETIETLDIQSIEDYFSNIETIGAYVLNKTDKDYFMRLPVDEEVFAIDANSRVINVPRLFKQYGIAVAGDSYAETIWFKIDKYYDIQDLGTADIAIRIYWELPGKVKGYSVPQYKDVWSTPGQVLFGWTIPQLLTEQAGNIKFSIRFFNDETGYNFNTLSQEVKIAPALIKIEEYDNVQEDATDRFDVLSRLQNSTASAIFIPRPTYSFLIPNAIGASEVLDNGNCLLKACAYAERRNDIVIEYVWYKGGNPIKEDLYQEAWFESKDSEANNNKYYYSDKNLEAVYENIEAVNNALVQGMPVYEFGSAIEVSEVGAYQVKAVAKIIEENIVSSSAPVYSDIVWTFEKPGDFSIDNVGFNIDQDGILSDNPEATKPQITITYPQENGQQAYATWTSILKKDGEVIEGATFPYEVSEAGDYSAEVIKTLNKESLPAKTVSGINVQTEAIPATVALATIDADGLIEVNSEIELVYTNIDLPEYIYSFTMQIDENRNGNWINYGNPLSKAPSVYRLGKKGNYRMIITSTYKRSTTTYTSPTLIRAVD